MLGPVRMIEVERLAKRFGRITALRDVSFRVRPGEVVGLLGPNGAGKTSIMRILTGFLGPTSGRVVVNGHDVLLAPLEARQSLGYMPEGAPLYPEMRVSEYLLFRARAKRVPRRGRVAAVEKAMDRANVRDVRNQRIQHLSRGFRQRVALADALVADPPLLVLDEPTAGLDPGQIREVRALIRGLGGSRTVLVSTHVLSEVESTCSRVLVLHRGRLVAEGGLDELREKRRSRGAVLRLNDPERRSKDLLRDIRGVSSVTVRPHPDSVSSKRDIEVAVEFGHQVRDLDLAVELLISMLVSEGIGVREAAPAKASLEDVFTEIIISAAPPRDFDGEEATA
ncbi:MAG: ABC transporter ATP-binding protein [Polyangiaceae bacterium]|nr:ABC transporter ATP-binding protein [Polyangiaceae bacterium]